MSVHAPRAVPGRIVAGALLAVALVATSQARAVEGPSEACAGAGEPPFGLQLRALTTAAETELSVAVSSAIAECAAPGDLKKVQIKTLSAGGGVETVENLVDVPSPGGRATITLRPVARHRRLEVTALVQTEQTVRTHVISQGTVVLLRPDLAVARLTAPRQMLGGREFTLEAEVVERNGDVGATATAVLAHAGSTLASAPVEVAAGGTAALSFRLTLAAAGSYPLELRIVDALPREAETANNTASATVEVTEFQLAPLRVLVPSLAGYGGQFNHHVYAKISRDAGVPENPVEMEEKVLALEPQLVRIFFNRSAFTDPDRMQSFVRTVLLAQRAGATINVTWQGTVRSQIAVDMPKLAAVLIDLAKTRGVSNLRWVTLQNEVNSTNVTPEENEAMYRQVDSLLRAAGVRDQIRFMGGDLVQDKQRIWLEYMAANMADLLDAWSIHVFWDYWDTPKLEQRLVDVRAIWDGLDASGRKPLYVSEYGVRGVRNFGGQLQPQPGVWQDGTPLAKTAINAFQHAWFTFHSARLGFLGAIKWDSYFGRYDNTPQAFYMIGSPQEGWPLNPVYFVTRLLTMTTRPGWQVVGLDGEAGRKLVTAYAGPTGELTVVGLDRSGGSLNAVSPTEATYSIGGLPALTSFRLVYWNRDGGGANSLGGLVVTDELGIARLSVPLHGAFALTTLEVPLS